MPDGPPSRVVSLLPLFLSVLTDGQHQLALARELHHAVVHVRAHPHEVVVVDEDAVGITRPVGRILLGLVAPALHHLAVLVEFDHDRRRLAAGAHRRGLFLVEFFFGQGLGQAGDPGVVLGVHEDAGHRAHDPVVRELLRPRGIDREGRDAGGLGLCVQRNRPDRAGHEQCEHGRRGRENETSVHVCNSPSNAGRQAPRRTAERYHAPPYEAGMRLRMSARSGSSPAAPRMRR